VADQYVPCIWELALNLQGVAATRGDLVVKAFQVRGFADFRHAMEAHFAKVYVRKPQASRDRSREVYVVGKGLKI
jgi:23S rRNA (uridine2552-2'-O)-methyltransferase